MIRKFTLCFALLSIVLLCGCASNHMTKTSTENQALSAKPGKALVHFMRPSSFVRAIQSTLYDGENYIGTISANTRVTYQAEPGEHMFMIQAESADFLQANLLADKIYYVVISPRPGAWTARFSFRPMNGQVPKKDIETWVNGTREVEVNEKGLLWAERHQEKSIRLKNKYEPLWLAKPEEQKQILRPESGE